MISKDAPKTFSSQIGCPPAETLVSYQANALSFVTRARISEHLENCDFCGAAVQLLAEHYAGHASAPIEADDEMPVRVPLAVLLLAQQLLPAAAADQQPDELIVVQRAA
jgi:anti-sigma factor ChrR (cupin superfamily)